MTPNSPNGTAGSIERCRPVSSTASSARWPIASPASPRWSGRDQGPRQRDHPRPDRRLPSGLRSLRRGGTESGDTTAVPERAQSRPPDREAEMQLAATLNDLGTTSAAARARTRPACSVGRQQRAGGISQAHDPGSGLVGNVRGWCAHNTTEDARCVPSAGCGRPIRYRACRLAGAGRDLRRARHHVRCGRHRSRPGRPGHRLLPRVHRSNGGVDRSRQGGGYLPEPRMSSDQGVAGIGTCRLPGGTAGRHGVRTGEVTVDFAAAMARKDALIDDWVNSEAESLGHTDGLTLLYGEARFIGRSDSVLRARRGRSDTARA